MLVELRQLCGQCSLEGAETMTSRVEAVATGEESHDQPDKKGFRPSLTSKKIQSYFMVSSEGFI